MIRQRAIQIGLARHLSEFFVRSILSIQDVTSLAHAVAEAHTAKGGRDSAVREAMCALQPQLPCERPYMPECSSDDLVRLRLLPASEEKSEGSATVGVKEAKRSRQKRCVVKK